MKRIKLFLSLLSLLIILVSCSANNGVSTKSQGVTTDSEVISKESRQSENIQQENSQNSNNEGVLYYLNIDYSSNTLLLINLLNDEVLGQMVLDKNSFIYDSDLYKLTGGYGVIVNGADAPLTEMEIQGVKIINFPQNIKSRRFLLFNEEFNVEKEFDLVSIVPEDVLESTLNIAVSKDGNKIVWNMGNTLYFYDSESKKNEFLIESSINDVFFEKIAFTNDNRLAFFGSSLSAGENGTCYGLINVDTKDIKTFVEYNYRAFDLSISNQYLCLTDAVEPYNGNKSSGKTVLLNLSTDKSVVFAVDGEESTMVRVTADGQYLLAAKKELSNIRVRQYNIVTKEIVSEHLLDDKDKSKLIDICQIGDSQTYAAMFYTEKQNIIIDTFECGV